jgi:hypothetical protein
MSVVLDGKGGTFAHVARLGPLCSDQFRPRPQCFGCRHRPGDTVTPGTTFEPNRCDRATECSSIRRDSATGARRPDVTAQQALIDQM